MANAVELTERDILLQILDAINAQRQVDVPSDFMQRRVCSLPANSATTITLESITEFGWLYIPNVPRNMTLHIGYGIGNRFGSITSGQSFVVTLPRCDAITLEFPTAVEASSVDVWLSTRPINVSKLA